MRFRKRLYQRYSRLRGRVLGIPPPGQVEFGDLRRLAPLSGDFGNDRGRAGDPHGQPVDRYYIENFLSSHAADIRGRVLEIGDARYTHRFGAARVTRSDVLHVREGNPQATIVADLAHAPQIADATFDCIILTQTLHLIYDLHGAIRTLHRIMGPGGVLLLTTPGITRVPADEPWSHTWYWSFTALSVRRMLGEVFGPSCVTVDSFGNVLAATAFLHGLAARELLEEELDVVDPDYPLILTAQATKSG